MSDQHLEQNGFCMIEKAIDSMMVSSLLKVFDKVFENDFQGMLAKSSHGHVYAARNLIDSCPEITTAWQSQVLVEFLRDRLGDKFGLVRALFFDKPPDRTWALTWHKDTSIAVKDNTLASNSFSRPTLKAGVPHVIADDEVLRNMLTIRIHLDDVTDENGPLRVIPGSHRSSSNREEDVATAVDIHAKAGDALAMRPLISHSSGASKPGTRRHRRILHLEFASNSTLPDGFQWHDFVPC